MTDDTQLAGRPTGSSPLCKLWDDARAAAGPCQYTSFLSLSAPRPTSIAIAAGADVTAADASAARLPLLPKRQCPGYCSVVATRTRQTNSIPSEERKKAKTVIQRPEIAVILSVCQQGTVQAHQGHHQYLATASSLRRQRQHGRGHMCSITGVPAR